MRTLYKCIDRKCDRDLASSLGSRFFPHKGNIQMDGGASSSGWSTGLRSLSSSIGTKTTELRRIFLSSPCGGDVRISRCTCTRPRFGVKTFRSIQRLNRNNCGFGTLVLRDPWRLFICRRQGQAGSGREATRRGVVLSMLVVNWWCWVIHIRFIMFEVLLTHFDKI